MTTTTPTPATPHPAAGYALLASAFVLVALLAVLWAPRLQTPEAQAAQVISRDNFTLMTAKTRGSEEALFVLDNTQAMLLVYNLNISSKRMELVGGRKLNQIFGEQPAPTPGSTEKKAR